jgi:hypothetical protein
MAVDPAIYMLDSGRKNGACLIECPDVISQRQLASQADSSEPGIQIGGVRELGSWKTSQCQRGLAVSMVTSLAQRACRVRAAFDAVRWTGASI